MKNDVHAISLNFRCSRSYLSLNDRVTLYLDIVNNLDVAVENIDIQTLFDNKYLIMVQNLFNCNDNTSAVVKIDKLNPREHTRIECSLELHHIPVDLKVSISSKISYNTEIDGQFIQEEIETNVINIKIYNIKIQDFLISSNKNFYRIGEIIEYTIDISNIGNIAAQNVLIKDFIPKDSSFIDDSIKFIGDGELFYLEKGLLINKINENSAIKINFKVSINSNMQNDCIKSRAVLEYRDYSKNNSDGKLNKIESNLHQIFISSGSVFSKNGAFVHNVDKEIAYLNEIINNKIVIKNKNKIKIKRATFKDCVNENLEYVKNTLTINGIPRFCENIYEGILLEDINLEEVVITYKTKVINISKSGKIDLNSKIYYVLDSEYEISKELIDKCTENSFFVYGAVINSKKGNFKRNQDRDLITIGEMINCSIDIENTGNLDARNLILKENIIDEVEFVERSFFINDKNIEIINLKEEINLGCLKSQEKFNIKYKLKSNTFTGKDKSLSSCLNFECLLLNGNLTKENEKSNSCNIKIEGADLTSLNKKVDKKLCKVNDILTFSLNLKNKGNIEALDIKIKDEKNDHLEFLKNSLYLNNDILENENIYDGVWKDILEIGEEIDICYKMKVVSLPKSNYTLSKTDLSYIHLINDKEIPKNEFLKSNDVKIVVVNPNLLIKDINSSYKNKIPMKYSINDNEIPFRILIKNDGNMLINEINFSEFIGNQLEFVKGSFKLDDIPLDDTKFIKNLKIKDLDCQDYREISFSLKPTNIENCKENLKVKSEIKYNFINSLNNELQEEIISFEEYIVIVKPKLKALKEVNKTFLLEGEEITETLILSNLGNFEIEEIEVVLPKYDFLSQKEDTLIIDNSVINDFPKDNKVKVGKLSPNEIRKISLRYEILNSTLNNINLTESKVLGKIKIIDNNVLNNINVLSNSLNILAVKNSIKLEQSISNEIILAGDNIKYFLNVKNTGNTLCKNAILNINIPKDLIYMENSLSINNSFRRDIRDFNNINLGNIKINETMKLSITFNVDKGIQNNLVKFKANINGECILLNKYSDYKYFKSDDLNLKIEKCSVNIYRNSDVTSLEVGDKILISSVISNEGSLDLQDVVFYEKENPFLNFIEDSLKINNKPIYLNESLYDGINVGEIKRGTNITVESEYEYTNGGFSGVIESFSSVDFSRINPSTLNFERFSITSNPLSIEKAMSLFKSVNVNGEIELSSDDPNVLEVSNLIINPSILNYYPIQTIKNRSYDNQILTGKKMIIEGVIEEKIEYVVDGEFSALYFIEKSTPFSTFIVMPEDNDYDNIIFECKVEDVHFKETNSRRIFRDINFVIEGY